MDNYRLPSRYICALVSAAAENLYVCKLSLSRVGADDRVALAVADCLQASSHISSVNLGRNEINNVGCLALAQALRNMPATSRLRCLVLEGNRVTDYGIAQLCQAVAKAKIVSVNLGRNGIGRHGLLAIASLLLRNTLNKSRSSMYTAGSGRDRTPGQSLDVQPVTPMSPVKT